VVGGLPGEEVWVGVSTSVLLVAGEADTITRPTEVDRIRRCLEVSRTEEERATTEGASTSDASRFHKDDQAWLETADGNANLPPGADGESQRMISHPDECNPKRAVKTTTLPAPASHGLLYDRSTYRTLAGLIQDFLFKHVDYRLSLGWQLQHLNTPGKWDVKNLAKWKKVSPTSEPIANTFVAMKMLREVDEEHNPVRFAQTWKDKIYAVIDISHANPVYDPSQLESGGIHYHKYPTVSKIPPTPDETRDFIALVDRLEHEITDQLDRAGDNGKGPRPLVGVHCHYGFNRTGFLIVSYLIERKGISVQDAINEFEGRRPPGIRHDHFIDTLFVRYCVGLQRAPTL
jgi:protein-tyrosine phosphatase